jgi:hypothetical protein
MSIISIINGMSPCNFTTIESVYPDENDKITLKYIDSKYYIENFLDYVYRIQCKPIKNQKLIKSWQKSLNINFDNSILFEFKTKDTSCLMTKYYSYVIEINKNQIEDFGLLTMNIFRLFPIGSFNSKLLFIDSLTSTF